MNVTNMFSDSKTKVDYVHILFALCFSQDASGNFLNLRKDFTQEVLFVSWAK